MRKLILFVILIFPLSGLTVIHAQDQQDLTALADKVEQSLVKGISFMRSLAIEGGYVYHYSMDGKEKWGEGKTDDRTIEVQPPGYRSPGPAP